MPTVYRLRYRQRPGGYYFTAFLATETEAQTEAARLRSRGHEIITLAPHTIPETSAMPTVHYLPEPHTQHEAACGLSPSPQTPWTADLARVTCPACLQVLKSGLAILTDLAQECRRWRAESHTFDPENTYHGAIARALDRLAYLDSARPSAESNTPMCDTNTPTQHSPGTP